MARIVSAIEIDAPMERVFDYATTPGNWPRWHPASSSVAGASGHSAEPGQRITEEIQTGGRAWRAVWTVRERATPHRWVIDGAAEGGGSATLSYRLTPTSSGTRFERELVYRMPSSWLGLLDRLVIHRRMAAELAKALRQLKQILESELGVQATSLSPRWSRIGAKSRSDVSSSAPISMHHVPMIMSTVPGVIPWRRKVRWLATARGTRSKLSIETRSRGSNHLVTSAT